MKNEYLIVEIEERFKEPLYERINVNNIRRCKDEYALDKNCPLCIEYPSCDGCPFCNQKDYNGCIDWAAVVLDSSDLAFNLIMEISMKKPALIEGIEKLRRAMDKYIKWI